MADEPATKRDESVDKLLAENRERSEQSRKEAQERLKGKPTPTQEENDRAKLGEHVLEKEDDGSGPDLYDTRNREQQQRALGADRPGGYQTRQVRPGTPQQPPMPPRGSGER